MPSSKRSPASSGGLAALVFLIAASLLALWYVQSQGWTLWYGDAEAHLDIGRRLVDSRTPGFEQTGTVWLPLPHWLMLPFAGIMPMWRDGLAGAIPSAAAFVAAGCFLFFAVRRELGSSIAAGAALAVFALNPNLLYLQSTPMTEALFLACWMGVLYFGPRNVFGAGVMAALGTMARYEGWWLIPFAALWILVVRRWRAALLFSILASAGPLFWLVYNIYYYSNALEFYNGPYSAMAYYLKGHAAHPGDHDWRQAVIQYVAAAKLFLGVPLFWMTAAGAFALAMKRKFGWLLLLTAVPVFYIVSVHSSGTPIFVPNLKPNSYYNTRYAACMLPLAAIGMGALISMWPRRLVAALVIALSCGFWLAYPRADAWICWKESQVNSDARRAWTSEAAAYLKQHYVRGEGIYTSFSDLIGIYREAGIPLRETLHEGNGPAWLGAQKRPDLMLFEHWAVCQSDDAVCDAIHRAKHWREVREIRTKGAPVLEIWRSDR